MVTFKVFSENCSHQMMIKEGKPWCGYKAKCWDDWKPCKQKNCPVLNKPKQEQQIEGQMNIQDILEGMG